MSAAMENRKEQIKQINNQLDLNKSANVINSREPLATVNLVQLRPLQKRLVGKTLGCVANGVKTYHEHEQQQHQHRQHGLCDGLFSGPPIFLDARRVVATVAPPRLCDELRILQLRCSSALQDILSKGDTVRKKQLQLPLRRLVVFKALHTYVTISSELLALARPKIRFPIDKMRGKISCIAFDESFNAKRTLASQRPLQTNQQ